MKFCGLYSSTLSISSTKLHAPVHSSFPQVRQYLLWNTVNIVLGWVCGIHASMDLHWQGDDVLGLNEIFWCCCFYWCYSSCYSCSLQGILVAVFIPFLLKISHFYSFLFCIVVLHSFLLFVFDFTCFLVISFSILSWVLMGL